MKTAVDRIAENYIRHIIATSPKEQIRWGVARISEARNLVQEILELWTTKDGRYRDLFEKKESLADLSPHVKKAIKNLEAAEKQITESIRTVSNARMAKKGGA